MKLNDQEDDNRNVERSLLANQLIEDATNLNSITPGLTQGDKLNQIKAMRRHSRSVIMTAIQ